MKNAKVLASVITALLLITGLATAQVVVTPYTATEIPVALIDPGTTTHPDGNTHIRGLTALYTRKASDVRVSGGTVRWVINYNLDATLNGPIWGSGSWENGGGSWEGTLQGSINRGTGVGHYDQCGTAAETSRGFNSKKRAFIRAHRWVAARGAYSSRTASRPLPSSKAAPAGGLFYLLPFGQSALHLRG